VALLRRRTLQRYISSIFCGVYFSRLSRHLRWRGEQATQRRGDMPLSACWFIFAQRKRQ